MTRAALIVWLGDPEDGRRVVPTAVIAGRGARATVLVPDLG